MDSLREQPFPKAKWISRWKFWWKMMVIGGWPQYTFWSLNWWGRRYDDTFKRPKNFWFHDFGFKRFRTYHINASPWFPMRTFRTYEYPGGQASQDTFGSMTFGLASPRISIFSLTTLCLTMSRFLRISRAFKTEICFYGTSIHLD